MRLPSHARKPPEGYKVVLVDIDYHHFDNMPLEEAINNIRNLAEDMLEPIVHGPSFDYYNTHIEGFVKMTDAEIAAAKKRSERARKAALARKQKEQEKEIQQLRKLQKKYPNAT